ncbi:unnamed protein product [Discula destructiva]
MDSGDAPYIGGNVAGDSDQGTPVHLSVVHHHSKDELRALLRAFVQSGLTTKETAESLFRFCCAEKGPWTQPSSDNNAAAPPPSPPSRESSGMSASSSRSSQNPATQPQTPTSDHNPSLAQHYGLDPHQQPQDDYAELRPFLLRLLAPALRFTMSKRRKVQDLYDSSTLPGHGTQPGFDELVRESAMVKADPIDAPDMASIDYFHAGISDAQQQHTPSLQATSPLQLQHQSFQGYQQSQSDHQLSHDVAAYQTQAPPQLGLSRQQQHGAQMQQQYSMPQNLGQAHASNHQMLASAGLSQVGNGSTSPFNHSQAPLHQGSSKDNAPSPTSQGPQAVKTRQTSRQKTSGPVSTVQASPVPPKKASSKDEKKDKEIAACTLPLADGQPCSWRSTSDKPWKSGFDHIRDHHPKHFKWELTPANKTYFEAMQRGDELIHCPLPNVDDRNEKCDKFCIGAHPFRSLIEHIRRKHIKKDAANKDWEEYYLPNIRQQRPDLAVENKSSISHQDTVDLLYKLYMDKEMPRAPPMEPSASLNSTSSGYSLKDSLSQQRDRSQDTLMQVPTPVSHSPQQVQQFDSEALQYNPNAPECVPPAMLQMNQMCQIEYQPALDTSPFLQPQGPNGPSAMAPLGFSQGSGIQDHRQHMNLPMTMHGAVAYGSPGSIQDPTLGKSLFPALDNNTTGLQTHGQLDCVRPVTFQQSQNNGYQQQGHQIDFGGHVAPSMANSSRSSTAEPLVDFAQHAKPPSRKRGREDVDAVDGESQGLPSKRTAIRQSHEAIATPPPCAGPAYSLEGQMSPDGHAVGSDYFTNTSMNNPGSYQLDGQSGNSAPPVDDVGPVGSLPAFDFASIGLGSGMDLDGGGDLGGEMSLDQFFNGTLYTE